MSNKSIYIMVLLCLYSVTSVAWTLTCNNVSRDMSLIGLAINISNNSNVNNYNEIGVTGPVAFFTVRPRDCFSSNAQVLSEELHIVIDEDESIASIGKLWIVNIISTLASNGKINFEAVYLGDDVNGFQVFRPKVISL